jgi:diguanylate cyclase (GGDEF)-like protein
VRLWAALFADAGLLGPLARRRARRFAVRSLPPAAAVGSAALVVLGVFDGFALGWGQAGALVVLVAALAGTGVRRVLRAGAGEPATWREQLELGSLLVVAASAVARTGAGLEGESPFQAVPYLVMSFLVAFLARGVGLALVAFAIALEGLGWWARGAAGWELPATVVHAAFLALFALLYHAVLAARIASVRRAEAAAVDRRLREIAERARELRLLSPNASAGAPDGGERERRWTESAVVEIEAAVQGALEIAEVSLRTHTVGVFLLSPDDRELRLREWRSASDAVTREAFPAGEGPLGGALKRCAPVRLHGEGRPVSYYRDGTAPRALLAVPLVDRRGGHVRGVLVADRLEPVPFDDADERLLVTLAAEVLRAAAAEKLMIDMKRARDEKARFFDALERLNRVTKPAQVFDTVLEVADGLVPLAFGAVTVMEEEDGRPAHRVARVRKDEAARAIPALEGLVLPDDKGLAASVLRLGSALPARGVDASRVQVLDPGTRLKGIGSLKVIPLRAAQEILGTVVLGARAADAFDDDVVRQLEVVAMQAAQCIDRARLFEKTERLATTDGLTGLTNHRTFQARLDEQLAQAARYGKKLALILCDIDHFKSVNDTHGHPMGDVVLKGVARTLQKEARTTDVVARYGGEEFALVMPETDAAGAAVIAERIRERVKALRFDTGTGPLKVTLSLGIAALPDDARDKTALIERADGCLYHAKRSGRDRTVSASSLATAPPARLGRNREPPTSPEPHGP